MKNDESGRESYQALALDASEERPVAFQILAAFEFDSGNVVPAKHRRAPCQAPAERDEEKMLTGVDRVAAQELAESDRHRRGAGVAVTIDVDESLLVGQAERLLRCR